MHSRCLHRGQVWQMEDSLIIWVTPCISNKILKLCRSSRVLKTTLELSIEQILPRNHLVLKSLQWTLEELSPAFQEEWIDNMLFQTTRCTRMLSLKELAKDMPPTHKIWVKASSLTRVFLIWTKWDSVKARSLTRDQEPTCLTWRESLTSKYSLKSLSHTSMTQTIAEISPRLKPLNRCLLKAITSHRWTSITQATFRLWVPNKSQQACSVYQRIPNFQDK